MYGLEARQSIKIPLKRMIIKLINYKTSLEIIYRLMTKKSGTLSLETRKKKYPKKYKAVRIKQLNSHVILVHLRRVNLEEHGP